MVEELFFYLLEVSVVNSFLLHKLSVPNPRNHLAYRRAIVQQVATLFIQQGPPRIGRGAPQRNPSHNVPQWLDRKQHFMGRTSSDGDCIVCSGQGRRHRTIYFCKTCSNNPFLCPDTSFERYHSLVNYKL